MDSLSIAVLLAAAWAVLGLAGLWIWVRRFGKRPLHSAAAFEPGRGVRYAFGAGLAPGAKESVRLHWLAYLAGLGFHAGVFTSLIHLVLRMAGHGPQGPALALVRILALLGACCGFGLLLKRPLTAALRGVNNPDDYLANGLSTLFAALTLAATFQAAAYPWLLGSALLLFLYLPLGKLRHCVFFFTTRTHFGAFFGRRGALPPRT